MSLRLDSAETGRNNAPQLGAGTASGSSELPGIAENDEESDAIPDDFWKPVETTTCATSFSSSSPFRSLACCVEFVTYSLGCSLLRGLVV